MDNLLEPIFMWTNYIPMSNFWNRKKITWTAFVKFYRGPQKLWTRSFLGSFKVFNIRSKFLAIVQSFYKRRNYKGLLVQSFLRSKFLNQKLSKVLFNSYNTVRNSFSCNYFGLHYRKCITDCILVISFSSYSLCIIFGNRL